MQATTSSQSSVRLFNPESMFKPTAGYSQVAEVTDGRVVYIAGQVALDTAGNLVGKDDFRAQVKQVFENLKAAVEAAEAGAEATKSMVALRGRASRLGERVLGHMDPGAASAVVILRTLALAS